MTNEEKVEEILNNFDFTQVMDIIREFPKLYYFKIPEMSELEDKARKVLTDVLNNTKGDKMDVESYDCGFKAHRNKSYLELSYCVTSYYLE